MKVIGARGLAIYSAFLVRGSLGAAASILLEEVGDRSRDPWLQPWHSEQERILNSC